MAWTRKINPRTRQVGHGLWHKGFIEPGRFLYDHELVLFQKGACRLEIGPNRYTFKYNQWVIVPPGVFHRSEALCDQTLRRWAHFDWLDDRKEALGAFCVYAPSRPDPRLMWPRPEFVPPGLLMGKLSAEEADAVYALMATLESRSRHSDPLARLTGKAVFLEILLRLLADPAAAPPSTLSDGGLTHQVKKLLDQMPRTDVSIRELLESTGQSYAHLCRAFKATYGLSPVKYLNLLRVETAKTLLNGDNLNISEIAEKCGYADLGYFSRVFKALTEKSPRRYRADATSSADIPKKDPLSAK
jgi:AraC-like DNA-binding protein